MNPRMLVPMAIVVLLFGAGSAMGLIPATSTTSGQVGNFDFQYNVTASVVNDLQYVHEGTYYNLTSQIQATSGTGSSFSLGGPDGSVVLQNATILNTEAENTFLILSNTVGSNISMALNGTLAVSKIDLNQQMSDASDYMQNHIGFSLGQNAYVYQTYVNGVLFYVFSNAKVYQSNGIAYFSNQNTPVLLGIVPMPALLNGIEHGDLGNGQFLYNQTTGAVTGKYLSFNLNNSTGSISDFQSTVFSKILFSSISVNATGSLGDGENGFLLPSGQPIILRSLFVYSNGTYVYSFHDNPALQSSIVWRNGSADLQLGPGLTAQIISTNGTESTISPTFSTNFSQFANQALESDHEIMAGLKGIYINGSGVRAFMFVNNANISITGNNILLKTNETARVSLVVPPGLEGSKQRAINTIYNALRTGKIAAEIAISGLNTTANITVHFNNTVRVALSSVSSGKATIALSSANHVGTNVLIFISNSVINSNSNLKVTFDGTTLKFNSVDGVLNTTSNTNALVAQIQTSGGILVLLHVPHFSNHTVVISSGGSSGTSPLNLGSNGGKLLVVGGTIAILAIVGAALVSRRKKNQ